MKGKLKLPKIQGWICAHRENGSNWVNYYQYNPEKDSKWIMVFDYADLNCYKLNVSNTKPQLKNYYLMENEFIVWLDIGINNDKEELTRRVFDNKKDAIKYARHLAFLEGL